jgi:hypothetical protein
MQPGGVLSWEWPGDTPPHKKDKPRIKAIKQRETGIGRANMDYCKSVKPRDPLGQIGLFFENFDIPAATGRNAG